MTHVLIVEDHEESRYLLQAQLEGNGCRVTAAGNGLEALAAARREPPDIIVSDALMPKMDGFALCRAWMQEERLRVIPFVFYSATYTDPEDERLALALGAVRYLVKPLEADVFLAELKTVLQEWAVRAAPGAAAPLEDSAFYALHDAVLERKLQRKITQLQALNRKLDQDLTARLQAQEQARVAQAETQRLLALSEQSRLALLSMLEDNERSAQALRRSNRALRALSVCNETLIHAEDEASLLRDLCQLTVETAGFRLAWIGYVEHDAAMSLRPVAYFGVEQGYIESLQITWADSERGQGPTGRAVRSGRPELTRDMRSDPRFTPWREAALRHGFASKIALPLIKDSVVFGTFSIYAAEPNAFDDDEVKLLAELADDLAFGILTLRTRAERDSLQQQQLRGAERLKRSLIETIGAVALTVEKRDPYTAGHQQGVAELCLAIGRKLDLPEDRLEGLRLGATIHDIGKIYVPAEILNRAGKLSAPEFELIQSHPQVGYDIIKDVQFPWPVADMILQHHERLDGSGYPQGLKAEQIILEARIIAVADVVEAMSSHRPYRPSRGIEVALDEIVKNRDRYDNAAADACVGLFLTKEFSWA